MYMKICEFFVPFLESHKLKYFVVVKIADLPRPSAMYLRNSDDADSFDHVMKITECLGCDVHAVLTLGNLTFFLKR